MKYPLDFDTASSFILADKERRTAMENLTISQVSRMYDVTPRMLRHYEKLGLIKAGRREDYAYRMYDEEAVRRLQQIIVPARPSSCNDRTDSRTSSSLQGRAVFNFPVVRMRRMI